MYRQEQKRQQKERALSEKKVKLIQDWANIFYPLTYTCIVDFVAYHTLENKQLLEIDLEKFADWDNIVVELKQGFILQVDRKKFIVLNLGLVDNLSILIQQLKKEVQPQKKSFLINSQTYKMCKKCREPIQKKIFEKCNYICACGGEIFIEVVHDQNKKNRLQKLEKHIIDLQECQREIDNLKQELIKKKAIYEDNEKQKALRNVSDFYWWMDTITKDIDPKKRQQLKIEVNTKNIEQAERMFGPKSLSNNRRSSIDIVRKLLKKQ